MVAVFWHDLKTTNSGRVYTWYDEINKLYIVSRRVIENINKNKTKIYKNYVGRYATSMEMAGMSVTVLKLNENIKKNLIAPSNCPFWAN